MKKIKQNNSLCHHGLKHHHDKKSWHNRQKNSNLNTSNPAVKQDHDNIANYRISKSYTHSVLVIPHQADHTTQGINSCHNRKKIHYF